MSSVLLSAIGNSILRSVPASNGNGNGSEPIKVVSAQFVALKALLEQQAHTLKAMEAEYRQELQAVQQETSKIAQAVHELDLDLPELRRVVEDLKFAKESINKTISAAGLKQPDLWWMKWGRGLGIAAVIALIFFLAGRYSDARHEVIEARQANARLIEALKRLPTATNVTTFVRSKGGDLTIDKIKLADGKDGVGIVISPGSLKLGPPSMSQQGGNALIPIDAP
jgi:hypothetical protein